jgi:putative heme-binding domain-containing protein
VLAGLGKISAADVQKALTDPDAGVRRQAVRLAEPLLARSPALAEAFLKRIDDPDAQVRLQLAFSLGEWRDARAARALAALARKHGDDPYLAAAVLSSLNGDNVGEVVNEVLAGAAPPEAFARQLLGVAVAVGERTALPKVLARICAPREGAYDAWQFAALAGLLDALQRRKQALPDDTRAQVRRMQTAAGVVAADEKGDVGVRRAALVVLGQDRTRRDDDRRVLGNLLEPRHPAGVQAAALAALGRIPDAAVAETLLAGWASHTPALRGQVLDLLFSRDAWLRRLLTALEKNEVSTAHLDAARRQRLLTYRDESVRRRAAKVLDSTGNTDRAKVVRDHADVAAMKGDAGRGKTIFARACAACHLLEGVGHAVGPDLAALANRTAAYLLTEILDPNRNVDTRYLQYTATTRRGQSFTGILAAESATSITLREQDGRQHTLLRTDLESLSSSGKSLMPEGLEKDLKKQDLADLIAYLAQPPGKADAVALAKQLLDEKVSSARRQALIDEHPALAAELVSALVADLKPGTKEEYRRIPWIWRVAVAAGKRNDAGQLRKLLAGSLPRAREPLRDWQAVVVGGGVINGISLAGPWPGPRLDELVKDDADLKKRWERSRDLAAVMADDTKVPTGTRYDALRMIALAGWDRRGPQLAKYLAKGTHNELTMGAISGLSDLDSPRVAALLLGGLDHFSPGNRKLAVDALLRTDDRTTALLDALQAGKVKRTELTTAQVKALRNHKNRAVRARAEKLLRGQRD